MDEEKKKKVKATIKAEFDYQVPFESERTSCLWMINQLIAMLKHRGIANPFRSLWPLMDNLCQHVPCLAFINPPVERWIEVSGNRGTAFLKLVIHGPHGGRHEFRILSWKVTSKPSLPKGMDAPMLIFPWKGPTAAPTTPVNPPDDINHVMTFSGEKPLPIKEADMRRLLAFLYEWDVAVTAVQASHIQTVHPNGPQRPCFFWWEGRRHKVQEKTVLLLEILWGKEQVKYNDVKAHLWPPSDNYSVRTFHVVRSRANKELASLGVPLRIKDRRKTAAEVWNDKRFVYLHDSRPTPPVWAKLFPKGYV